ncbi:MAG: type II toxin-antitoxin system VapC family toxin [Gemmatimonadaceae bacterium]
MRLLDLNILIYAVNSDSAKHEAAKRWVEDALSGSERVVIPWPVILGFLRIVTSPRVMPRPLPANDALAIVDSWLAQPPVVVVHPGEEHWTLLRRFLKDSGTAGNLTMDAHLAVLAMEHGAELYSTDSDFARFPGLRWLNPLA